MFEKDGAIQLEGLQRHISKFDILRVAQFLFYLLSEIIPYSAIKDSILAGPVQASPGYLQ